MHSFAVLIAFSGSFVANALAQGGWGSSAAPVYSSSAAPVYSSSAAPVWSSSAAPVYSSSAAPVSSYPVWSSSAAPVYSSSAAPVSSYPAWNSTYIQPTGTLTSSSAMPYPTIMPAYGAAPARLAGSALGIVVAGGVALVL